jgi:hypothetical protein
MLQVIKLVKIHQNHQQTDYMVLSKSKMFKKQHSIIKPSNREPDLRVTPFLVYDSYNGGQVLHQILNKRSSEIYDSLSYHP